MSRQKRSSHGLRPIDPTLSVDRHVVRCSFALSSALSFKGILGEPLEKRALRVSVCSSFVLHAFFSDAPSKMKGPLMSTVLMSAEDDANSAAYYASVNAVSTRDLRNVTDAAYYASAEAYRAALAAYQVADADYIRACTPTLGTNYSYDAWTVDHVAAAAAQEIRLLAIKELHVCMHDFCPEAFSTHENYKAFTGFYWKSKETDPEQ